MHSSINLVSAISTSLCFWSLARWACIWVCDPQTGSSLSHLPLQNAVIWGQPLFLYQSQAGLITTPTWNPFSFLFRFLCLVECLCLGFCFIKQIPNCFSISPSHPGSVVDHRNLGWKRPSGLPLSLPGLSSVCRACLLLIGICNIFQFGNWLLSFLSLQPLLGGNGSEMGQYQTKSSFGLTGLINKWLPLSLFLLSLLRPNWSVVGKTPFCGRKTCNHFWGFLVLT